MPTPMPSVDYYAMKSKVSESKSRFLFLVSEIVGNWEYIQIFLLWLLSWRKLVARLYFGGKAESIFILK